MHKILRNHCVDDRFGGPGPMFRIAFPAFSLGRRKVPVKQDLTPRLRGEFENHFGRDLKPLGYMDSRLSAPERHQIERTNRLRDALFSS